MSLTTRESLDEINLSLILSFLSFKKTPHYPIHGVTMSIKRMYLNFTTVPGTR